MNILVIAIILFLLLESSNVFLLYFKPGSTLGNAMGVFHAWEKSKQDPEIHALVSYLVNWVAGTKLIFIALLLVIVITGREATQLGAVGAMILSIFSFFWRLYPAICQMDTQGQLTQKGFSRTLGLMIAGFILVFSTALVVHIVLL